MRPCGRPLARSGLMFVWLLALSSAPLLADELLTLAPPSIEASGYLLQDANSGDVLAAQEPDEPLEPASITKLMSGYVLYRALANGDISLEDQVTISRQARSMGGSRMFVEQGSRVSVGDLLMGMVVQSGNDATVALAEHYAGSEEAFVNYMNHFAKQLGMSGSRFANSTGLPGEGHVMTARDIATLTRALILEFPEDYVRYSAQKFTHNGITQHNRNRLLWKSDDVDGVKTGYTRSAGYCLVASAVRDDMRLISVVLGTDSRDKREQETMTLLNYGFNVFQTHLIYPARLPLAELRVWKGASEHLPVGLNRDLYVTVPRNRQQPLMVEIDLTSEIMAPVEAGQVLGEVAVSFGDHELTSRPVAALSAVDDGGIWRQAIDTVLHWVH